MEKLGAWGARLLWIGLGFFLASVVFVLRPSGQGAVPSSEPAREAPLEQTSASPPPPDCYLGVIVSREAADVSAESEGRIEKIEVRVGDPVERGQKLAELDTRTLRHQLDIERAARRTAEARARQSRLELDRARQENARRQELSDVLSREELEASSFSEQESAAGLEAAEAELQRVEARIAELETQLRRAVIRAPYRGKVGARYLDPGARVRVGEPVVRLLSSEGILARFAVPPAKVSGVGPGMAIHAELEATGRRLVGEVEQVAPEVDGASQMIFVEARLELSPEERDALPPGSVARVSVGERTASGSCLGP